MVEQSPPLPTEVRRLAYGAREIAIMFGVTERTVRKMLADGQIRTFRLRGRVLIPASEVDRLLTVTSEGGRHVD